MNAMFNQTAFLKNFLKILLSAAKSRTLAGRAAPFPTFSYSYPLSSAAYHI
jgi:hypothetical protein